MATKHFGKGTLVQPIRDTREHTAQGPLRPGSQALRPLSSPAPVRGGDGQGKGQGLREERLTGCGRGELLLHSLGHMHSNPKRGARASPPGTKPPGSCWASVGQMGRRTVFPRQVCHAVPSTRLSSTSAPQGATQKGREIGCGTSPAGGSQALTVTGTSLGLPGRIVFLCQPGQQCPPNLLTKLLLHMLST